ncbi:hypothetical protein NQ314_012112 [Rhamnusium bicolor]|uniref:Cytochrome P450 n=1 Tax=Rhamnusium bicolor TaxID=1586634 RepID=A0AAV8XES4_9CUCU|nr:hypothetical protein NQ314_012112 [Rhamnusium bicolor]
MLEICTFRTTIGEWLKDFYDSTKEPFFGIFVFDEPYLVLKSPELIKQVLVKDFSSFTDRTVLAPKHDKLVSSMMFLQKSPHWKTTRPKMTPIFTSGKLKGMFPTINNIGLRMNQYIRKNLGQHEAKEICAKFSTDVIAKCAFGINSHCFDDEDAQFRKVGRSIFDFRWRNAINQTAYFFMQGWANLLHLNFVDKWATTYLKDVFWSVIKQREETNMKGNDLIDIIVDMRKNKGLCDEIQFETLRKYPVLPFLDRRCNADYQISGTNIVIEKGMPVYIPMLGLHYDEQYFPEPDKYKPERFSDKNAYNGDGLYYLPFGEGPRICIGERFGVLGTKVGLVHILSEFEIERTPDTPRTYKI